MDDMKSPPKPRRFIMMPEQLPRQQLPDRFAMQQIASSPASTDPPANLSQYPRFDCRGMAPMHTLNNPLEAPMLPTPPLSGRVVAPSPSLETIQSSERNVSEAAAAVSDLQNFENQMVDRAMNNLPTVISEVFSMQKGQTNDIQALQQAVQQNKDKISAEEEKRDELLQEMSSITKRIYMTEESIKENGKACKLLNSDIKDCIMQLYQSQRDAKLKEEEMEYETRKLKKYKEKKAKFADEVDEYETSRSEIQKKMNEIRGRLSSLRQQKSIMEKDQKETERIVKGIVAKEVQSDIEILKQKIKDAESDSKIKQEKIENEKEKQNQINQTMQVLQKRNSAQLTRLRRQFKDVQLQNKQWSNQITNLQMKINQLQNDVDTD